MKNILTKISGVLVLTAFVCLLLSYTPKDRTWVAIGDSITYLNDHLAETGNRVTKGYLTRVVERIAALHYINQGHNGWTAGDIAAKIEELGLVKADNYTVFLGTNDWWQGRPLGTLEDYRNHTGNGTVYGSFRIIIDKLRALNSDGKIILITPMQRTDFVYIGDMKNNAYGCYREKNGQLLRDFAAAVDSIGQFEKLAVVDLYNGSGMTLPTLVKFKRLPDPKSGDYREYPYPDYTRIPFNPETDEYPYPPSAAGMTYDGLHPSDKGNEVIARMLEKVIKRTE